jgi:hypothetical protein
MSVFGKTSVRIKSSMVLVAKSQWQGKLLQSDDGFFDDRKRNGSLKKQTHQYAADGIIHRGLKSNVGIQKIILKI